MLRRLVSAALFTTLLVSGAAGQAPPAARDLSARIDAHIQQRCAEQGIELAPRCSDAQFLRRLHVDLTGRIPSTATTRSFLADTDPLKREKLIDRLLDSPAYVSNFSEFWRDLLMPEAENNQVLQYVALELDAWLRKQLSDNTPLDQFVRQIITVPLTGNAQGPYAFYSERPNPLPTAFFAAKDVKPENLATATARLFLGMRVDCAQCHDHPFADWKREQFWKFAAFYGGIDRQSTNPFSALVDAFSRGKVSVLQISIPETDQVVPATFLDGTPPPFDGQTPREMLAEWITARDNPYFARAAVNRYWAHCFGRGLVEPIDDLLVAPATHPELLDELAVAFRESGYDVKYLLRALLNSEAYQRSSESADLSQQAIESYSRKLPRKMLPREVLASVYEAMGRRLERVTADPYRRANLATSDAQFQQLIAGFHERPILRSSSPLEALLMLNGELIGEAAAENGQTLVAGLLDFPLFDDAERLRTLFLATLSREPTAEELQRLQDRLNGISDDLQRKEFFADVMWALLNSTEFVLVR
jgi:hypothetical protein